MEKSISVIIPTTNRYKTLISTIKSILRYPTHLKEIIIIDQSDDDCCKFNTSEFIHHLNSSVDLYYLYEKIPSSTKARNIGMRKAHGEILVFCDDDIELSCDVFENLVNIFKNSKIGLVAGINELDTIKRTNLFSYLFGFRSFKNRKIGHITKSMLGRFPIIVKENTDTMWAMGFFFACRKSLVNAYDLKWDEKLTSYAYGEDLDFSYSYYKKATENGYKCIVSNLIKVKHLASLEYRVPKRKSTFMYVLNRAYLSNKHGFGKTSLRWMKVVNFVTLVFKLFKRENANDMLDAMNYLKNHQKDIMDGNFYYGES